MLKVNIDKIVPVTDARAKIASVIDDVMRGNIYVLTRGGKPVAVVAPIQTAEKVISNKVIIDSNDKNQSETLKSPETIPAQTEKTVLKPIINNNPQQPAVQTDENQSAIDISTVDQALKEYEQQKTSV